MNTMILKIVNLSLESAGIPSQLKKAILRPLLKKPNFNYSDYKNFQPILNLTFLLKVTEKF